jgi:hypothetical protein
MGTYLHIAYEAWDKSENAWRHHFHNEQDGSADNHPFYTAFKNYPLHFFFRLLADGEPYDTPSLLPAYPEEGFTYKWPYAASPETWNALGGESDGAYIATLGAIFARMKVLDAHVGEEVCKVMRAPEVALYRERVLTVFAAMVPMPSYGRLLWRFS